MKLYANCYYCSVEVTGKNRHEDHFEPRSRGGTDLRDNKVPACGTCNALNHHRGGASWRTSGSLIGNR